MERTYAIGDVHGCYRTLMGLLERLPGAGRWWQAGDLVNRGPASLAVLRWARAQPEGQLRVVLGNHDLHLLCRAAGVRQGARELDEVLGAPDRIELVEWLRHRPLLHRDAQHVLVHAGLLPGWTVDEAEGWARLLEQALQGPGWVDLLSRWRAGEGGDPRVDALDGFTRLRTCTPEGAMDHEYAGPPEGAEPGYFPWFAAPGRRWPGPTVVFGHWAALGLYVGPEAIGLDTGCAWGRCLTAIDVDDRTVVQQDLLD